VVRQINALFGSASKDTHRSALLDASDSAAAEHGDCVRSATDNRS